MADSTPTIPADDIPLFEGFEPPPAPEGDNDLSADRRRTKRQADLIAGGIHPLTKRPIHRLASRHRDARSPKSDPFTCGSCYFREVLGYHGRAFPKCTLDESRVSHSAASDVRAWWPACTDYSPGDRLLSPDAARSIPEVDA